jgi:hypothetical protein
MPYAVNQGVGDALLLQREANGTHIDAVRRTENDWMVGGLHQFSPCFAGFGFASRTRLAARNADRYLA